MMDEHFARLKLRCRQELEELRAANTINRSRELLHRFLSRYGMYQPIFLDINYIIPVSMVSPAY